MHKLLVYTGNLSEYSYQKSTWNWRNICIYLIRWTRHDRIHFNVIYCVLLHQMWLSIWSPFHPIEVHFSFFPSKYERVYENSDSEGVSLFFSLYFCRHSLYMSAGINEQKRMNQDLEQINEVGKHHKRTVKEMWIRKIERKSESEEKSENGEM